MSLLIRLLFVLLLSMPLHREARAVEPATIMATAALISSVASLFDKGADPTATNIAHIRIMMELLHTRLEKYDQALLTIMNKLDDMPDLMQTELEKAFAHQSQRELLADIELIVEDVGVLEKGTPPQADMLHRLGELQRKARIMMKHDDYNLPLFVTAMRIERAYINAIKSKESDPQRDWEVRERTYQERITEAMWNLVERANRLEDRLNKRIHKYDAAHKMVESEKDARDLLEKLHKEVKEKNIALEENIITLYRKMVYRLLMEYPFYMSKFAARFISEPKAEDTSKRVDNLRFWMDASEAYAFQILSVRNQEEFRELFPGDGNITLKSSMPRDAALCVFIYRVQMALDHYSRTAPSQPMVGPSECAFDGETS